VKILADLFHMNLEEASIPQALLLAGARLGHVHFADSNRQAIGFGHTDLPSIAEALRKIGYVGGISAEILPLPDQVSAATQTIKAYQTWFAPG
jgi:sugar phosphate isomerase/epimerase